MYKVRVENLETGEVIFEHETDSFIAAINLPETDQTHTIAEISAPLKTVKANLYFLDKLKKRIRKSAGIRWWL